MLKLLRTHHKPACQTVKSRGTDRAGVAVLLYDDSTTEICSTVLRPGLKSVCSSASDFFNLGLESVEDNSEHDLAGMADYADIYDSSDIA